MADYFYTTYENQVQPDGSAGVLWQHFFPEGEEDDEEVLNRALAKLYTILAAAALSRNPYHSGHIYRSDDLLIDGRVFHRRKPKPAPEPEEG